MGAVFIVIELNVIVMILLNNTQLVYVPEGHSAL
jgi:hypothetical protein